MSTMNAAPHRRVSVQTISHRRHPMAVTITSDPTVICTVEDVFRKDTAHPGLPGTILKDKYTLCLPAHNRWPPNRHSGGTFHAAPPTP
jgi:hypothetical protein